MHRRRLPHLHAIDEPIFVTFRLHGSLPPNRPFPRANVTSGEAFVSMDQLLDSARCGPTFLRRTEVASEVASSIQQGQQLGFLELHAWVIMPNHVRLLMTPQVDVSRILRSMKSASAKKANLILGRSGAPFWQDESYDHLVRNADEFRCIRSYIEQNPVRACLAVDPEEYPWSSAGRPERPVQGTALPHKI